MMSNTQAGVLRALRGFTVLVVGGEPRFQVIDRLKQELGLATVIHAPTRKNDPSSRRFASKLYEPSLAFVVCARGLSRTQHGRDLHDKCRELGLPLVNCGHLPHPNALMALIESRRLATQIIARCVGLRARRNGGAA